MLDPLTWIFYSEERAVLQRLENRIFCGFLISLLFVTFNRELLVLGEDARVLPIGLGLCLYLVGLVRCFRENRWPRPQLAGTNHYLLWYFVFALVCNVAWLWSDLQMVEDQFATVVMANVLNLFFWFTIIVFRRLLTWRAVSFGIHVSGVFLFLSMLLVYRGFDLRNGLSDYPGGYSDGISSTPLGMVRYAGFAQDPNFASLFMIIWGTVALFDAWRTRKISFLFAVPFAGFGYIMSFSKSILVMLAVAIVFVALNRFVVGAIAKELALVGLIFGTLLAAFGLINLPTETLQIRTLLWQEPIKWLSQSPIIGNGLTAARSANLEQGWYLQIHSTVVQTLIELGIVGLLLLYLAVRRSLMNGNALIVFITGAFLGTMVTYETMSHTFAVLILGILPLAIKQTQVKNAESASIYVINGIAHGGAERVVQNMANNAHENEKVIIYLLAEKPSDAYSLSQNVEIRGIGKGGSKLLLPFYLWRLNRWLENDWAHHRITLATAHLPFAQLVARLSRFNSEFIYVNHGMFGVSNQGFSSLMTKFIYNQRLNVAVSQQMLEEEVRQNFGVVSRHDDFIYNPIDMQAIAELAGPVVEREKLIVSIGRYSQPKNLSAGIAAFDASGLADEGYVYKLLGEGELRTELQQDIDARGLNDAVELVGFVDNPFAYLRKAAALIHPANYESFGMVIAEAHVCGCPVVAFDVPFAAREVMPGRLRSFLVQLDDTESMGKILRRALEGEYPREDAESFLAQLEPSEVMQKYYDSYAEWTSDGEIAR